MALGSTPRTARRVRVSALVALPLSLVGHGLAVGLFLFLSALAGSGTPSHAKPRAISLRALDAHRWASNRGASSAEVAEPPAPLHPRGQVVDVAPGNNRVAPDAKYLAETNNRVLKETRARNQTSHYSRATAKTQAAPEQLPAALGHQAAPVAATAPTEGWKGDLGVHPSLSELFQRSVQGHQPEQTEPQERAGTETGTEAAQTGDATEGGGAPNDDLSNVEAGDGTYLNTREWKYAGFFNRVKQAVAARWDPNRRLRAKNQQLGLSDRVTMLVVTLRPDGSLYDAFVSKSCGIEALDLEAVQAFERAQPFANPPLALVEKGFIRFGFGFTVVNENLSAPTMWRMPR